MANNNDETLASLPFFQSDQFLFSDDLIARWTSIPGDVIIQSGLTREDIDRFFFMHGQLTHAIGALQSSVVHLSHTRVQEAAVDMDASAKLLKSFQANVGQFVASIMMRAVGGPDAK